MDNFFIKGAKGVNKIKIIDEATFNAEVKLKALEFKDKVENPTQSLRNLFSFRNAIMENTHGGILDFKMYELNYQDYYKNNIKGFIKNRNSINEPNSRTLYIYKGIAYNLNEYGNLKFGAAHAYLGTNLEFLIKM